MCLYAYNKQTVLSRTACVAAPRCEKRVFLNRHCTLLLPDGNIRKISHAQDLYSSSFFSQPSALTRVVLKTKRPQIAVKFFEDMPFELSF